MAAAPDNTPIPVPTAAERVSRLATALACWFVAACFVVAWWWPRTLDDGRWVAFGVGILLFEFLTIHASAFLTFGLQKTGRALEPRAWAWIVAMYVLMAAGMAAAFGSWFLLISFLALLAGRVRAMFVPEDRVARVAMHRRVAVSAMLFLLLAFATVLIPMPAGGIDAALLNEVWPRRGDGLWEQRPQQALAMGVAYFLVLGGVEARPPGPHWYKQPLPAPTRSG